MDFAFLATQMVSGFSLATLLFLNASGLTLIFGVGRIFNFAHGSFYMLGAYFGYQLSAVWGLPFWPAILVAGAGAGIVGSTSEYLFLRRIYGRPHEGGFQILLTYCLILIFDDLVKMIWGSEYKSIAKPPGFLGAVQLGDVFLPTYNLAIIAVGLLVVLVAWWILSRTRAGRIARASAVDREILGSLGINVPLTLTVVFGLATALGGMTGALAAPLRSVTPGAGIEIIIDSLIVVVLGGMGNFWGAWFGAILLGEVNAFAVAFVPEWSSLFSYIVMVLTLIFRPEGLFAPARIRKA